MAESATESREKRRLKIWIDPEAFLTLGLDPETAGSSELRESLRRQAALIARGAAEADRAFDRASWLCIADACNGLLWDDGRIDPRDAIRRQLNDRDASERIGAKWFPDDEDGPGGIGPILMTLHDLDVAAVEAVAIAIRWFWANQEAIDPARDRWWTPEFRRARATGGA